MDRTKRIYEDERVYIKVVAENNELITEYLTFLYQLKINNKVYLMPQGKTRKDLIKNSPITFDLAEEFNMNFSSRDHIIYEFV